jgi:formate transporter
MFSGLLALIVGGGVPGIKSSDVGLQKFIFGGVFPVGLMLVIIAGAELFTGNTAVMGAGVLAHRVTWKNLAYNWTLSYIGNFIGRFVPFDFDFYKSYFQCVCCLLFG